MTGVLVIMLSLTVDLSHIHNSHAELKRTSDSAALAACWELFDTKVNRVSASQIPSQVLQTAESFSQKNLVANESPHLSSEDVVFGKYNFSSQLFDTSNAADANAIRIDAHRQSYRNGQVSLFFGSVLGRASQPMSVSSTAALIGNIGGFNVPETSSESLDILPFALDVQTWEAVLRGETGDSYSWTANGVETGTDGLHECNLYPQGTGSPGNRGTVDIGSANNSTNDIARQIVHGISREDMLALNGPLEFDSQGKLRLNGDTGISAGVKDELASIIGQKRIIPIFQSVSGNGNNAMYTIVKFAGVRILRVRLTGAMNQKHLTIQPAPIVARNVKLTSNATQISDYVFSPAMLVK